MPATFFSILIRGFEMFPNSFTLKPVEEGRAKGLSLLPFSFSLSPLLELRTGEENLFFETIYILNYYLRWQLSLVSLMCACVCICVHMCVREIKHEIENNNGKRKLRIETEFQSGFQRVCWWLIWRSRNRIKNISVPANQKKGGSKCCK